MSKPLNQLTLSEFKPKATFGKRPKWAKPLTRDNWRHLQEGQRRNVPTLSNLEQDATTCDECGWILKKVQA